MRNRIGREGKGCNYRGFSCYFIAYTHLRQLRMTITDVSHSQKIYQGYRWMLVFTCTDIWYNFSFCSLTCQKSDIQKTKEWQLRKHFCQVLRLHSMSKVLWFWWISKILSFLAPSCNHVYSFLNVGSCNTNPWELELWRFSFQYLRERERERARYQGHTGHYQYMLAQLLRLFRQAP